MQQRFVAQKGIEYGDLKLQKIKEKCNKVLFAEVEDDEHKGIPRREYGY